MDDQDDLRTFLAVEKEVLQIKAKYSSSAAPKLQYLKNIEGMISDKPKPPSIPESKQVPRKLKPDTKVTVPTAIKEKSKVSVEVEKTIEMLQVQQEKLKLEFMRMHMDKFCKTVAYVFLQKAVGRYREAWEQILSVSDRIGSLDKRGMVNR